MLPSTVTLAFWRQKQDGCNKFEAVLVYIANPKLAMSRLHGESLSQKRKKKEAVLLLGLHLKETKVSLGNIGLRHSLQLQWALLCSFCIAYSCVAAFFIQN